MTISNRLLKQPRILNLATPCESVALRTVESPTRMPASGHGFRRIMVVVASEETAAHCLDSAMMFIGPETNEFHLITLAPRVAPEWPRKGPVRNWPAGANLPRAIKVFMHESISIEPEQDIRRLAYSFEIDLLVMIAHPGPGLLSVFLKRADERILRAAPCPVVTVPCPAVVTHAPALAGRASSEKGATANPIPKKSRRNLLASVRSHECAENIIQSGVALAEKWNSALNILITAEFAARSDAAGNRCDSPVRMAESLLNDCVPEDLRGWAMGASNIAFFEAVRQSTRDCGAEVLLIGSQPRLWQANHRIDLNTERIVRGSSIPVLCIQSTQIEMNHWKGM